jgi:hypothetical protein
MLGGKKHKFRFKNKLLSLDSTTISLCLKIFPWAKLRRAKGGVKAHVLLDHDDYLPAYVLLTEAKRSDVKLADSFRLNSGSIVAIDRGYIDYAVFARWSMAGVFFVTRLKDNAAFEVVEECQLPLHRNIRADQLIRRRPSPSRLPRTAAARCGLACRQRVRDRLAHQSAGIRRHHHRGHLQRALGNRTVLR